jgi:hypothetical protein
VREQPLLPESAGRDGHYAFGPSPSGRLLAVSSEDPGCGRPSAVGTALFDLDAGERLALAPQVTHVSGFAFDASERRWAAVKASRNVRLGGTHEVVLFDGAERIGAIDGPFEPHHWQEFADGLPFALSPDGCAALLVRPGGRLERWTIDPRPARAPALLPRIEGAAAVRWPTPELALVLGPRVLAFLRMPSAEALAIFRFPA